MQQESLYTVEEAARALKRTPSRIRQMLRDGELEGVPPQERKSKGQCPHDCSEMTAWQMIAANLPRSLPTM
jgi:hypothetical protein